MAAMIKVFPDAMRVLDPGAGTGMLTAALCERISRLRSPRTVEVHAYESDPGVVPLLSETLAACGEALRASGHAFRSVVHERDFALDGPASRGRSGSATASFDIAILNPPYFKIPSGSALATAAIGLPSQTNIYAVFMALALHALRDGGQFVSITPRSFCAGPYFRPFRQWLLANLNVEHLYLYGSRTATFADSEVLQESLITAGCRSRVQQRTIEMTHAGRPGEQANAHQFSECTVFHGGESIIRLPATNEERRSLELLDRLPHAFADLPLQVSTGPVVMFRANEHIGRGAADNLPRNTLPLLSVQNVFADSGVVWPARTERQTLSLLHDRATESLLIPPGNYVLTRRFTAKEESRRLVAAALIDGQSPLPPGRPVALENHLNFIRGTAKRAGLSIAEARGITAYLNSPLLDSYLRAVSGNTQVNASDIRALPFLPLKSLATLGSREVVKESTIEQAVKAACTEPSNGQVTNAARTFTLADA
jgi:adenine-specific DNA-methyltransferase